MTSNALCASATQATSNSLSIPVFPTVSILNFNPASGTVGSVVTINGTNFSGVTNVSFNGVNAFFIIGSNSQITATVPPGATTGVISVTNICGTVNSSSAYSVTPSAIVLNLKLFIEGYYTGGGEMKSVLSPGFCETVPGCLPGGSRPGGRRK